MISHELVLGLFATVVALSFPFWSWTHMLTAVQDHEEGRHARRERQARDRQDAISDALASMQPLIVDLTVASAHKPANPKWAARGFLPGVAPIGGGLT